MLHLFLNWTGLAIFRWHNQKSWLKFWESHRYSRCLGASCKQAEVSCWDTELWCIFRPISVDNFTLVGTKLVSMRLCFVSVLVDISIRISTVQVLLSLVTYSSEMVFISTFVDSSAIYEYALEQLNDYCKSSRWHVPSMPGYVKKDLNCSKQKNGIWNRVH